MEEINYTLGRFPATWKFGNCQTITFIVTEDCNLRCKYCYITHKKSNKKMSFETAKEFINMLFNGDIETNGAVILDFIGGEPFLEINLIEKISDYFKITAFENNSEWSWNYKINICTNGVNYNDERIQNFLEKNNSKVSLSITIDGTKDKHDLNRVFPNGQGSYDKIVKNIPLWISRFHGSTKVTFSSPDLVYLKDSIISLWNMGIKEVAANVVFEDVWNIGDDKILEDQLSSLADYAIEHNLYNKYYCTFFDDAIGAHYSIDDLKHSYCGAGKIIALGPDGTLYPCLRYKDYSLNHNCERNIGSISSGIDMDKVRPFILSTIEYQSDEECLNCPVATGCGFCQGFNYDDSDTESNFYRAKYICKMHKARVRANNYYFNKLYNILKIDKEGTTNKKNYMYITLCSDFVDFCDFSNDNEGSIEMNKDTLNLALEYCFENFYEPILLYPKNRVINEAYKISTKYRTHHILPIRQAKEYNFASKDCSFVFSSEDCKDSSKYKVCNAILNLHSSEVEEMYHLVANLINMADNIKLNIHDLSNSFNLDTYEKQLLLVKALLCKSNNKKFDVITDMAYQPSGRKCLAGSNSLAINTSGNIYICPLFCSNNKVAIGSIQKGITNFKEKKLFAQNYQPLCRSCDVLTCHNCYYRNKAVTLEYNIPSSITCKKSHIEHRVALEYSKYINPRCIETSLNTLDPIDSLINEDKMLKGFYNNGGK